MDTNTRAAARVGADCLAQIGPTRFDIIGIRFVEGEGSGGGDGQQQNAGGEQQQVSTPPWGTDPSKFDPDKAWKLIENLRTDLSETKTKTEQQIAAAAEQAQKDTLAQFAKLLSGEKEPETDPAKLAATIAEKDTALTAAQTAVLEAQRTAQVAIHAGPLGANIAALLADPAFKTSLASVDPTKEADIKSAITKALQENAALKQPPARSGTDTHTGPTIQSLEQQLAAATEKKDWNETIRLKQLIAAARMAQA